MRLTRLLAIAALAATAALASACANRTGDASIAEYCAADEGRANHDICKQNRDLEGVRVSLGQRIDRAQATADQAMVRQLNCTTRTMNNVNSGSCENGAILTACTQTRYTRRAGGMAILRSVSDTECRYNGRVLEVQVRCCTVGDPITQTNVTAPQESTPAPSPTS